MAIDIEQLHFYLSALDSAAHAITQARRIKPEPGLDRALEQLHRLLAEGGIELQQAEGGHDAASVGTARGDRCE